MGYSVSVRTGAELTAASAQPLPAGMGASAGSCPPQGTWIPQTPPPNPAPGGQKPPRRDTRLCDFRGLYGEGPRVEARAALWEEGLPLLAM